ncbi:MAG: hypothetical protein ACD_72C00483G0001 [uncultured bacterium]|nr:MAG: hypothetical protein ACD_72C00483G0001 [uncultured bacterium]
MFHLDTYFLLFSGTINFLILLLGLILGSFLNSWIWRTHDNVSMFGYTRSMCVHCRRQLSWYENIPLLSFLVLKGKCRTCKKPIPFTYPLVELLTAFALWFAAYHQLSVQFSEWVLLRDVFYVVFLIIIFFYDLQYQLVLSKIVWSGVAIALLVNWYILNQPLEPMLIGAVVGGGFFWLQYVISKGRWIGGGDVRLGFMMGVWLGWPNILAALFFAYILGAIISIFLLISKKAGRKTEIPFGTFLAVSTFFTLYYGDKVVHWYVQLLK